MVLWSQNDIIQLQNDRNRPKMTFSNQIEILLCKLNIKFFFQEFLNFNEELCNVWFLTRRFSHDGIFPSF